MLLHYFCVADSLYDLGFSVGKNFRFHYFKMFFISLKKTSKYSPIKQVFFEKKNNKIKQHCAKKNLD